MLAAWVYAPGLLPVEDVRIVVDAARQETKELVKPVLIRPHFFGDTKVPFSEQGGPVSVWLEGAGEGHLRSRQTRCPALSRQNRT